MSSKSLLDKFRQMDNTIFTVSQFSHTGEGFEDRLEEPDTVIAESMEEFTVYINHILKRIDDHEPQSSMLKATRLNVEALQEKVAAYPNYGDYVISFEYLKKFVTSPTYGINIRHRLTGEVLSMTHVSL